MMTLLNPRIIIMLALAGMLAFTHLASYRAGKAAVRAEWTAEKLAASESARLAEKARNLANQKIDHDLQIDKARRAATDRVTADRLREFQAATNSTSDNAAPASGADDPYPRIASECAAALAGLDIYASGLASTAKGLQGYASQVCLADQAIK